MLLRKSILALSLIILGFLNANAQEKNPAHLGLFYPISTHGTRAPDQKGFEVWTYRESKNYNAIQAGFNAGLQIVL